MAPRPNDSPRVITGMKRSAYHEGDQKTSCKKWCYHPSHEGVETTQSKGKIHKPTHEPQGFPLSPRTRDAIVALCRQDEEKLKVIMQEGRTGLRKNYCNCTLLQLAVRYDLPHMVKVLKDTVDVNAVNRYGQTAAHLAALRGNTVILRMLIAQERFNPDIMDVWGKTYIDMLAAPLFTAVLWSDENQIEDLLELGADPDGHAGKLVEGITARELRVSTPRELAIALNKTSIVDRLSKITMPKPLLKVTTKPQIQLQEDTRKTLKGFASIFTYGTFEGHPDLAFGASRNDADNLARTFSYMGYNGDIHSCLTAEQTLDALRNFRSLEMMGDAEASIFYFSSIVANEDGPEDSFITSDLRSLRVSSIVNIFRESNCPPHLKDKPKIFIFDLLRLPKDKLKSLDIVHPKGGCKVDEAPYSTRSRGALERTVCLYSSLDTESAHDFSHNGSAFSKSLVNIFSKEGQRIGVNELFEKVKKELKEERISSKSYLSVHGFRSSFVLST